MYYNDLFLVFRYSNEHRPPFSGYGVGRGGYGASRDYGNSGFNQSYNQARPTPGSRPYRQMDRNEYWPDPYPGYDNPSSVYEDGSSAR